MTPGNALTPSRRLRIELALLLLIVAFLIWPYAMLLVLSTPSWWHYWKTHQSLNPQLMTQRNQLIEQASAEFGKGFVKLSEQYPQVRKSKIQIGKPNENRNQIFVDLIGEELPPSEWQHAKNSFPTKAPPICCGVFLGIKPYEWIGFIGHDTDQPFIFPNLNLKAFRLYAGAEDPQLDAALKQLLRDVLQPLRELDAKSGPIKAPDDLDDLHWNVLATTAPATTQQ